eukprot:IDg15179t1
MRLTNVGICAAVRAAVSSSASDPYSCEALANVAGRLNQAVALLSGIRPTTKQSVAMAVHVALRGDAGLDAWVAHGAEAGARTQRVAAALRAARARAERALASHDCEAFEAVVSDVPQSNDPFADAPRLCANDYAERARAKHRAARELLRERRRDVRERLASTEAAEKAHRARVDERIAADAAKAVADKHRAAAAADAERRDAAARRAAAAAARKAVADNAAAAKRSASALTPVITSTTATTATTTTTTTTPPRAPPAATAPATVLTSKKTTSASIVAATKPSPAAAAVTQSKKPEWPADAAATRDAFKVLVEQGKAFRTSKDGGTKRARLSLKKAINLAANQVAASQRQVARCVDSLAGALHTAHGLGPAVHAWAVVEVARRLVSDAAKGEQGAAQFALAYVLSGVVSRAPNVPVAVGAVRGVLLEICCYVAPVFPRRRHDEKDSAYRQRIGARDEEGAERYSNRMAA